MRNSKPSRGGGWGATAVVIALVTIGFQLTDPVYRAGVVGVTIWYALAIAYFAAASLMKSPAREAIST
jgi:ethanolamine permease